MEALQGIILVLFLTPMLLGLEDKDTILGDPLVVQRKESGLDSLGEGGLEDVKAQVDGGGNLVDVLATGPLGPNKFKLDFLFGNTYSLGNVKHDSLSWVNGIANTYE